MIKRWWYRFHDKRLQKIKFKFITWFYSKYASKYCWADCVAWVLNPQKFNPYKIDNASSCKVESETDQTEACYCGSWRNGKCWG